MTSYTPRAVGLAAMPPRSQYLVCFMQTRRGPVILSFLGLTESTCSHLKRSCFCPACSKSPNGYRSLPTSTYYRHNPRGQAHAPRLARPPNAPLAPLRSADRNLQESLDITGTLEPEIGSSVSPDEESHTLEEEVVETYRPASPELPASAEYDNTGYHDYEADSDSEYGGDGYEDMDDDADMNRDFEPADAERLSPEPPGLQDILEHRTDAYNSWLDANDPQDGFAGLALQVDRIEPSDRVKPTVVLRNVLQHHDLEPAIRHLYTTIAFSKAVGLSNIAAATILEQTTAALNIAVGNSEEPLTSPTQVITAMSRLGVNPDDFMERRIVCPNLACWHLVPYQELYRLESPACGSPLPHTDGVCTAALYSVNGRTRTPYKVMPFTPLSTWLALFMQDDAFVQHLNDWRGSQDECPDNWKQAMPTDRSVPYFDRNVPLDGLSEGSAWRSGFAHTQRSVFEDNSFSDDPRARPDFDPSAGLMRHCDLPFGLKIIINIDW